MNKLKEKVLRNPLTGVQLFDAFKEAAGGKLFDAVLHVIEAHAVCLSAEAGIPMIPADEAKACARAASALREAYSVLEEWSEAAKQGNVEPFREWC